MKLSDIQETVRSIVANCPYFAGDMVLLDDGRISDVSNTFLADPGFLVIIGPVTDTRLEAGARGVTLVRASLVVELWENPEVNPTRGAKDMLSAVSEVVVAITEFRDGNGSIHFEPAADLVQLVATEPGLRGYWVSFSKLVQLS